MIRYCKQKNEYDCGPVAILNALKWSGSYRTLKDLSKIKALCKTDKYGTFPEHFYRALWILSGNNFEFAFGIKPPVKKLMEKLEDSNRALIVGHIDPVNPKDWHYSFWYDRTERYIKVINYDYRFTYKRFLIENMPKYDEVYWLQK